jgi:hypothetical protein
MQQIVIHLTAHEDPGRWLWTEISDEEAPLLVVIDRTMQVRVRASVQKRQETDGNGTAAAKYFARVVTEEPEEHVEAMKQTLVKAEGKCYEQAEGWTVGMTFHDSATSEVTLEKDREEEGSE